MKRKFEYEFRIGFQIFLFFLVLQFFGPVLILMNILPLNFGLVWPAVSVLIASYVMIENLDVKNLRSITNISISAWSMIVILNTLNYLYLELLYSLESFFLSSLYLFSFIMCGSLMGKAFAEE
jgi:hypothetical protein